jgi:hypothetical protein
MDAYVAKPISAAELVTTIESLVAGHPAVEADGGEPDRGLLAGSLMEGLKQSVDRLIHELGEISDRGESPVARLPGGTLS